MSSQNEEATQLLSSLPFEDVIGGPLVAAIQAQAQAASTTVDFINEVAFVPTDGGQLEPINITFLYDSNGVQSTLTVPLLTIIPIPYLRIEEVNLDFKANLSGKEKESESSFSRSTDMDASASKMGWGPVKKFDASLSTQTDVDKSKSSGKVQVEYNMNVNVRATQDEMPAGMARVLGILSNSITANVPAGKLNLTLDVAPGNTSTEIKVLAIGGDFQPIVGLVLDASLFTYTSASSFTVTYNHK
jgi:hypothetical protein